MSRTGTTSLFQLMEALGFKSRHFFGELIADPDWNIPEDLQMLNDSPVPMLYKQLDKKYPGSKFILTTRDKKTWLESMKWMFTHGMVIWNWAPGIHEYHKKFYHTSRYNKRILSRKYDDFHNEVKDYFKDRPNDLLTINIDKGIDIPIVCRFLNIPVREVSFPKTNERKYATLRERLQYNWNYMVYGTNDNL
jgi:hypothetical protein